MSLLGAFSILFVFFAERNDEQVSLFKSIIKTLVAAAITLVAVWIASLFLSPIKAIVAGVVVGVFFFMTLWSALGWIKSILITILTFIGLVFVLALGFLILRGVVGDTAAILEFLNTPTIKLLSILKIGGILGGVWLIMTQLRSGLFSAVAQAIVSTVVSLGILILLIWIAHVGIWTSLALFVLLYVMLLWIMRFRMVSNLFAETVRIVRIGLILVVTIGVVVWIIL